MVEPEEESQTQAIQPKSKNIVDDREAALMDFDLDLDAFWPLDPIHFPSNPTSPALFSSTDPPCSPLWGFPDGDADNDDKLAGQVDQALFDRPQFSSCIPDPGREIPRENEDRRMLTSPFLGLEPVENPDAYCLIKEKITQTLRQLKELTDQHVLAQFWAPVKNGGWYVVTTSGQPFVLDPHTNGLHQYRMASLMYMFSVDGESDGMVGLPGHVFQQKLPEWTPNVQYSLHQRVSTAWSCSALQCSGNLSFARV
ncbi:protein NLP7 [Prunus yedoensis var. nudiflora]|uniref:Protein NLP7 n=1 Tax=Prunus yedoensis var. nudiflora TaxID=2094558 RepID=A0A314UWT1_PRUYE|nr:protein NLP7 [Prunus yedoensis var. nudiflora]